MKIRFNKYYVPQWWKRIISRSTHGHLIIRVWHYNIWFISKKREDGCS